MISQSHARLQLTGHILWHPVVRAALEKAQGMEEIADAHHRSVYLEDKQSMLEHVNHGRIRSVTHLPERYYVLTC